VHKTVLTGKGLNKRVYDVSVMVDSSSEDSEGHDYTNIKIDSEGLELQENKPYVANAQNNGVHMQQVSMS